MTYSPESGNAICVHDSHSETLPVILRERGAAFKILPPRPVCTRIHGSNGVPSGRCHVM